MLPVPFQRGKIHCVGSKHLSREASGTTPATGLAVDPAPVTGVVPLDVMPDTPVIEVEALHKVYRDGWFRRRRLEVLKELAFEVRPGEIFGLLGPNGAGKTTFVKILLGIVRTYSCAVAKAA